MSGTEEDVWIGNRMVQSLPQRNRRQYERNTETSASIQNEETNLNINIDYERYKKTRQQADYRDFECGNTTKNSPKPVEYMINYNSWYDHDNPLYLMKNRCLFTAIIYSLLYFLNA